MEAVLPRERHLRTHEGHLTFPNAIDRKTLTGEAIRRYTLSGDAGPFGDAWPTLHRGLDGDRLSARRPRHPARADTFARMAGLQGGASG